jgi:5-methylcytosine-specific restriction endonuclease McrBC GTP-binding regulatory subunit McrB
MLLVLLDEMNLARVEYYFSELLSKLEMRSRAQLGDHQMYERSAIQVQAGSLKDGDEEQNRPLFVGYNVLFVGTMNEDETTQALSDKVLDRANVLRFGKPSEGRTGGIKEREADEGCILHKDSWEEWITPSVQGADAEFVRTRCEKINNALQMVGRAFGHRIYQAIEQYVANYPSWVDDRREKAFSDQLEQKILPKLRGLSHDTDDGLEHVFNEISEVIAELNDPDLATAFSVAREKPVFDFKGVSREA